jgi:integrase
VDTAMRVSEMNNSPSKTALEAPNNGRIAIKHAAHMWAMATTSAGARHADLIRDKQRSVASFFDFIKKHPAEITPIDVQRWLKMLEERGLRPSTIYQYVCLLSSFYTWLVHDPELGLIIRNNPAKLARPKAPKAYQNESAKSLSDKEMRALVSVVKQKALSGDVVGKRDYAILLLFMATGMRRAEILSLRGRDVTIDKTLVLTNRVKGGTYIGREVSDAIVKEALIDYLTTTNRMSALLTNAPLWTRHDNGGRPGAPLTSHCYARNLKRYARIVGIEGFHMHRTRHTFARIVAEETGSIVATQDALDHKNPSTTRVYVQRIAVKRDRYSESISTRLREDD